MGIGEGQGDKGRGKAESAESFEGGGGNKIKDNIKRSHEDE